MKCEMCGETFEAKSKLARLMAKEAERKGCDIRNVSDRKYIKAEIKDENMIDIARIAKEARKRGMTYGQFVARGRCV